MALRTNLEAVMMIIYLSCLFDLLCWCCSADQDTTHDIYKKQGSNTIPIIVLSQPNLFHAKRAELFKQHLFQQTGNEDPPDVYFLHERWVQPGAWTVLAIIPELVKQFPNKAGIFFCEEETRINLTRLYDGLGHFDFSQELFLGSALRDKEATIIHHFAFHKDPDSFSYPHFAAGFVLSMSLIKRLNQRMKETHPKTDFSIDAKHELAMYIWDKGAGLKLQETDLLCDWPKETCATHHTVIFPDCGAETSLDDVMYAVKTCEKYHKERVSVVKNTWSPEVKHVEFYSDVEDPDIPTINIGIENTERGHCGKTIAILRRFNSEKYLKAMKWLVIADDDTLLSVPRLQKLLSCYDPNEPIALGERYGYGLNFEAIGYNYLTGGAGMVFSRQAVKMMMDTGVCKCSANDDPDDMMLGICLKKLGITITHSRFFHQARPEDYAARYLHFQAPVSFHKHWNVDPYQVYNSYLTANIHDEL